MNKVSILRRIAVILTLLLPLAGHATVIWDEGINGDLANSIPGTDLGVLGSGTWDVIGSLDGTGSPGPDEHDVMKFTTTDSWTLDVTGLNLISTSALVDFFYNDGSFITATFVTGPSLNIFGTYVAGTYQVNATPSGNTGELTYAFRINVQGASVPEPSSLVLLSLGLFGLGFNRRKRLQ